MFRSLKITIEFEGHRRGYVFPVMVSSLASDRRKIAQGILYELIVLLRGMPGDTKDKYINSLIEKWARQEAKYLVSGKV